MSVPQADEQQRLLANLILRMNLAKKPLPRFWYFPRGKKAVVVMTGDDHGNGGTAGRFDQQIAASPAGCNVANWECVRSTLYIFAEPQNLTNCSGRKLRRSGLRGRPAHQYRLRRFHPGIAGYHLQPADCRFQQLLSQHPGPDHTAAPLMSGAMGDGRKDAAEIWMRLDTTYYFWPPGWAQDRPGHFTGSAMPMRFADLDGTLIDVYNAPTQMTDESGQSYPFTGRRLIERGCGPSRLLRRLYSKFSYGYRHESGL